MLHIRHYEKRNKNLLEIISIADKEREKNCKVEKAFQNDQTAELLANNEINTHTIVTGRDITSP